MTDDLGRGGQQILEQVDLVVGVHALHHGRDTLQAHAGIDGRLGQRVQRALGVTVELHEDQVPDLDVAIAIFVRAARRATGDIFAVVIEDLGGRATRAGVAHLPEVVLVETREAVLIDADLVEPDVTGFVIADVHGDPQLLLRQAEFFGQKLPGELDGFALEVVAEAEVAQHLEEGVVTGGIADVVQVIVLATGAHAALRGGRTAVATRITAQEDILEGHHAGVGEQQGRVVVRHQGAGGNDGMALLLEIGQEGVSDFCAFHRGSVAMCVKTLRGSSA